MAKSTRPPRRRSVPSAKSTVAGEDTTGADDRLEDNRRDSIETWGGAVALRRTARKEPASAAATSLANTVVSQTGAPKILAGGSTATSALQDSAPEIRDSNAPEQGPAEAGALPDADMNTQPETPKPSASDALEASTPVELESDAAIGVAGDAIQPNLVSSLVESESDQTERMAATPVSESTAAGAALDVEECDNPTMVPAVVTRPMFHIFVIDSGWRSVASEVLRENLPMLHDLLPDSELYVLNLKTSRLMTRRHGSLIGRDPIIAVHDMRVLEQGRAGSHGVRIHLGMLRKKEQVLSTIQMLVRFLSEARFSAHIEREVRTSLLKEGISGAIEIIARGAPAPIA